MIISDAAVDRSVQQHVNGILSYASEAHVKQRWLHRLAAGSTNTVSRTAQGIAVAVGGAQSEQRY
jgi:hypothetical protein